MSVSDPLRDECFGGVLNQFLLEELLGYEDIILYSLKQLADDQPNKGTYLYSSSQSQAECQTELVPVSSA